MDVNVLEHGIGFDAAGGRTDPGTVEIRPDWMNGSSLTNRVNRKQSGWKNAEHIILTDAIEAGFIDDVWKRVVARDKTQPSIQKLYVHHGDTSQFEMYDAEGLVASGSLTSLLLRGLRGSEVKVGLFAKTGFDLVAEGNLWQDGDLEYLISVQSGTDFKTHAVPVLKIKQGIPNEVKINGNPRYYPEVVYSIGGGDYYLTKEWRAEAYDVLAEWFVGHGLTLKRIVERINLEAGGCMFKGNLGVIQKIVYGAPGTGKSFDTDEKLVDGEGNPKAKVFRTTFHPDSDYSTFVGAYKPTSIKAPRIALDGTTVKKAGFGSDITADQRKILEEEDHITYSFRPQAFMNAYVAAWKDITKPVVLIIEEINRGNCAQIFGDLFQLLDRDDKSGYSTYPITADTDLKKWLAESEQFGSTGLVGIAKPDRIKQPDWDQILKGEMLALPPNLYIWATMNTSDQSLFPIDSAFKRRWDWKYVPIREGKHKNGQPMNWKIKFTVPAHQEGGQEVPAKDYMYDWWDFLKCVNKLIFKTTDSEDKKLGYFFVKPDGKSKPELDDNDLISADRFVSKVIFYLWNDVFKDYGIETIFKVPDADKKSEEEAKGVEFQAFFNENDDHVNVNTLLAFFTQLELKPDEEPRNQGTPPPTAVNPLTEPDVQGGQPAVVKTNTQAPTADHPQAQEEDANPEA